MTHPLIQRIVDDGGHVLPPGTDTWGIKSVRPDLTTRNGFRWPFPGGVADQSDGWDDTNRDSCPNREGDGVCTGLTWRGMASGDIPARTLLLTAHDSATARGDDHKVRAPQVHVVALVDGESMVREHGRGADLQDAYLQGANLQGADLRGADLWGANLQGANLQDADLRDANLEGANLKGADLKNTTHDGRTTWPAGFGPAAKGVER